PLEEGGSGLVREVTALEVAPAAQLPVRGQPALDGPLSQERGAPEAVRPTGARQRSLEIRRIALQHPAGRAHGDRTDVERREPPERARDRIAGGASQMRDVR